MSDSIKHECAVALLRLLDGGENPGSGLFAGSSDPGGTALSLLLEKQHNRGQDGAGAAILSLDPQPGAPAYWMAKSASPTALADVLGAIALRPGSRRAAEEQEAQRSSGNHCGSAPFAPPRDKGGERIFLGHLRYATYGRGDESFCHPFVHAEPRLDRTLLLAGNFNLTNTHELFEAFRKAGNHASSSADGYLRCELLAEELAEQNPKETPRTSRPPREKENTPRSLLENQTPRTSRPPREKENTPRSLRENQTPRVEPPILHALRVVLPKLDGAFTLCGMTGDGWAFAVRDAHGIRPGWYHTSPRVVAVASERPAIQAAFDVPPEAVRELPPGEALLISPLGEVRFERVLPPAAARPCSFERIYFSRANDADIQRERRALGAALLPQVLEAAHAPLENIFFSYIPNSAQIAFHGLLAELFRDCGNLARRPQCPQSKGGKMASRTLRTSREPVSPRFGQIAVKDAKFRTFIADAGARREIGRHVYDVVYGLVRPGIDTLVVLDDSIVRGNTMRNAILPMLDRLGPKRIVVASSAPPIRYPDCYGIDMSTLGELVAFRALVNLLGHAADAELHAALEEMSHANSLAPLYARFSEAEHSAEIARLLTPPGMRAEVCVVFQTVPALHAALSSRGAEQLPSNGGAAALERAQSALGTSAQPTSNGGAAALERAQVVLGTSAQPTSNGGAAALERAQSALGTSAQPTSNAREARFGDWYFTGDYPTPGGYRVLRTALANYLEHNAGRSY